MEVVACVVSVVSSSCRLRVVLGKTPRRVRFMGGRAVRSSKPDNRQLERSWIVGVSESRERGMGRI